MWLQAGDEQHQERSLLLHKTVGLGGGVEAESFPTEGWGCNPEGATAILAKQNVRLQYITALKTFAYKTLILAVRKKIKSYSNATSILRCVMRMISRQQQNYEPSVADKIRVFAMPIL